MRQLTLCRFLAQLSASGRPSQGLPAVRRHLWRRRVSLRPCCCSASWIPSCFLGVSRAEAAGYSWGAGLDHWELGGNRGSDNMHDMCPPQGPETLPRRFLKWTSATSYQTAKRRNLSCVVGSLLISVRRTIAAPLFPPGAEATPGRTPRAR